MPSIFSNTLLNEEQVAVAQAARDFAQKEIMPIADKIERDHKIPQGLIDQLGEMGFLGMMIPTELGGSGLDTLAYTAALEEIAVACASTSVLMSVNNSLACWPIWKFGTKAVQDKYLRDLATGKKIGCYCLTETTSGSDSANMKTRAVKKGNKWVLSGVKNFITNGREAEVAVVYATVDPAKKHKGVVAFVVEKSFKGYQVAKFEEKLGLNGSSTAQIVLDNVEVPEENMLGTEENGFNIAMATLDGGRIGIATQAIGIGRACLEEALRYSLERESFGKPIAHHGSIQNYLADMGTQMDAARLLMRDAAARRDRGEPFTRQAAQAKLFAAEACMWTATKGVQILGGYGYTRDYPMERHFRDAKITEIYEGTSEIQRIVIARNLTKEITG